ncbi:hypothetical protein TNCV_3564841 [Trichonephila clavipes]|nr:hypothetical protein TNCV_3564841 [Trichonephila clavipes]
MGLIFHVAAVAEWYRDRIRSGFVASSSPLPLKTRRVGQQCTLKRPPVCVIVIRGGANSGVVHDFDYGSKLRGPSPKALV